MKNILFIVTSHSKMGSTNHATGVWFEELSSPYYIFKDAGHNIDIVSITGGIVPIDPNSQGAIGENPSSVDRFLKDEHAMNTIKNTKSITEIDIDKYSAIFIPGGHGTMWDLPENNTLASIVNKALEMGKVVAAVCHGPSGLVSAVDKNGDPIVKGRKVAAFTNKEEEAVGLTEVVPFSLEDRLRALGADIHQALDFEAFAIADGNLITGQNPASSEKTAELVISKL
ncbi:type 1 glutamine amidotransferase domain-containing protein [Francisella sp. 19X1-34]|uniref:type 1 glutamine amidotransferase domain-containing protein n=1 Tax=Francisella sp. 19X1-34 TaxID=3087177 RepID=UPI002E2EF3BD|nr:type 1 glutamine amidotransferase domain-containing protein [Francisella sp. 19X1-34]MED7788508.1 type 1 glutamine amidotransferase domain-containing protein [Francisella sp. 19X1-34]